MAPRRTKQIQRTRQAIGAAVTALLAEGNTDFSVQDVADRAGVTHRTVYRHFATREELLANYLSELEAEIYERAAPITDVESVPEGVRHNYAILDELSPAIEAIIRLGIAQDRHTAFTRSRTESFLKVFESVTGHLPPDDSLAVAWVLRHLASNQTWLRLKEEGGVEGDASGRAVAWALETLLAELESGGGPAKAEQSAEKEEE